jgi:hypothetical protein
MTTIRSECACGATLELEDAPNAYINEDGSPDKKGRLFPYQIVYDTWLEAHKDCPKFEARTRHIDETDNPPQGGEKK